MMSSTMFLMGMLALMAWLSAAVLLRFGCAMCRVPKPGLIGAMILVLVVGAATMSLQFMMGATLGMSWTGMNLDVHQAHTLRLMLTLPVHMLVAATAYKTMLPTTFGRGMMVWIIQAMLMMLLALAFAMVVSRVSPAAWAHVRDLPMTML